MRTQFLAFMVYICLEAKGIKVEEDIFLGEKHYPGLVTIRDKIEVFYWLFKARNNNEKAPLIIWLEGGPGCCTEEAIFLENGPFRIEKSTLKLTKNEYSWSNLADVLFIDQPVGTGFSNAAGELMTRDKEQMIRDYIEFYIGFLEQRPEYAEGRDLYLAGQSYGGHFVAYYAKAMIEKSYNIKGISIGNGYFDPSIVYLSYPQFAYTHQLISTYEYFTSMVGSGACSLFIKLKWYEAANFVCPMEDIIIVGRYPNFRFNPIDIRPHSKWIYATTFYEFIQQQKVKDLIGVGGKTWDNCNSLVEQNLIKDYWSSSLPELNWLLALPDLRVMIYFGEEDYVCNILSGEQILKSLNWIYKSGRIPEEDWRAVFMGGEERAKCVGEGNKSLCRVLKAGHMAIWNQPEWASYMITNLLFHPHQ